VSSTAADLAHVQENATLLHEALKKGMTASLAASYRFDFKRFIVLTQNNNHENIMVFVLSQNYYHKINMVF